MFLFVVYYSKITNFSLLPQENFTLAILNKNDLVYLHFDFSD